MENVLEDYRNRFMVEDSVIVALDHLLIYESEEGRACGLSIKVALEG